MSQEDNSMMANVLEQKKEKTLEEKEMETLNSWISYALRETMEEQRVRNGILKKHIKDDNVVFSKTMYGNHETFYEDVKKLLRSFKKKDTYYLFTISNPYDPETDETHFQSFIYIYDTKDTSQHPEGEINIYGIDPSNGYYNDRAIQTVTLEMRKIVGEKKNSYMMVVELSNACQRDESDVFCQTWSLYLQLKGIQKLLSGYVNLDFEIPEDTDTKYNMLVQFYKSNMDVICAPFKTNFNRLVNTKIIDGLLDEEEVEPTKQILKKYKKDICDIIENKWDYKIFHDL